MYGRLIARRRRRRRPACRSSAARSLMKIDIGRGDPGQLSGAERLQRAAPPLPVQDHGRRRRRSAGASRSRSSRRRTSRSRRSSRAWPPNLIGQDPVHTEALWRQNKDQAWWYGYGGGIVVVRGRGDRHRAVGPEGQGARRVRARPARRPGARAAAGDRVVPRPLRGDPGDGRGGPGVALDRPAGRQGRLRQAWRRAARLRARPRRRVRARRCARASAPTRC